MSTTEELMAIPAWLDRKITPRPSFAVEEKPPAPAPVFTPPERFDAFTVHLMDEMPAIGSGQRTVFARVGRKWVRVQSECGRHRVRLRRPTWERLGAVARPTVEVVDEAETVDEVADSVVTTTETVDEPPTERTEQGEQYIAPALCGPPITEKTRLQERADAPIAPRRQQAACDVGLFDDGARMSVLREESDEILFGSTLRTEPPVTRVALRRPNT